MNNEPVAWMDEETGCFVYSQYDYEDLDEYGKDGLIPLYTHPVNLYQSITDTKIEPTVVSYTHPVKDREKDRLRFSDEAFNRWLDESISDSGHTVYDLVENVCEAWHGWENSQYYTHPVKELTDRIAELENALESIDIYLSDTLSGRAEPDPSTYKQWLIEGIRETRNRARAILRKAQEK